MELRQVWALAVIAELWWSRDQGKGKDKGKGNLNNAESSNLQEGFLEGKPQSYREQDEQYVYGWWKTTDWQAGSSSGWWMTANDQTHWETEEPVCGFEINSTEGCCSKGTRRGKEQRVRRWQRPRKETVSVRAREEGRGTSPRSSAQFMCDSRDECTDKEKTNSNQPRTDRSEN